LKSALFLSAAQLIAAPAIAQDANYGEEIVVLASGFAQPAIETGQAITVVTRDRIDELQSATVADVLRTMPSISVAQRGPVGGQTSVFVRAGNSSQTLVLIDGVRVNDPSSPNAAFDFGGLITGNINRIEVLRGPNSIIWGSQAIGGVINIETARPASAFTVTGGAEYGSQDTFQANANVGGETGPVRYSLGGAFRRTDGFSMFEGSDERDGSRQAIFNGRVEVALASNVKLDLRGSYSKTRNSYDSIWSGGADSLAKARNRQWLGHAGLSLDLADGRFRNRFAFTRSDIDRVGTDPVVFSFNTYIAKGVTDRFEYRGAYDLTDAVELVAGVEHERIKASTSYEGFTPDKANDHLTGEYAQLTVRPIEGLTVTGGLRHDSYSDYGSHTALGGNVAYTPDAGKTVFRATYAEGFRAPTLTEGQPPYGNLDLKPETARNLDLGVEHAFLGDKASVSVTLFRRRSTNLITFSSITGRSENVGKVRAEGVEVALSLHPTSHLHVEAGYALVDAKNRSETDFGKRLQLRPRHSGNLTVDWETPLRLKLGATLLAVGDSFDDAANTVRIDGHVTADLRASYPVTEKVELFARIENLWDEDYETVAGYNTAGRTAFVGARLRM
jgi:vitamin B12 transporter